MKRANCPLLCFFLQCVICCKVLPNSSMVPVRLRRHIETVCPEQTNFFKRRRDELVKQQKCMNLYSQTVNKKATEAAYIVSYHVAQAGGAHTIAESLTKPCIIDIVKCRLDEKSSKLISTSDYFSYFWTLCNSIKWAGQNVLQFVVMGQSINGK